MTKAMIAGVASATVLLLLVIASVYMAVFRDIDPSASAPTPATRSTAAATESDPSAIFGRVTTSGGTTYEGRLRWGRDQEALWGHYFNGVKKKNPWAVHLPSGSQREGTGPIRIFGIEIGGGEGQTELVRPFMARFGDIVRIELAGRDIRVTLKSGTVFDLDYFSANDFDDGVRVWDAARGIVDLDSGQIRTIDLLPSPHEGATIHRLHGTVRTPHGDFTGFIQWNRNDGLGSDELDGRAAEGYRRVKFDTIRSIARGPGGALVTLIDGSELALSGTTETGDGYFGTYVDDPRYGRVLISWNAFERLDFSPGGSGPHYAGFSPGRPLNGSVTTRTGRRMAGRLVFDLDESETTETLDAPSRGVDYTLPFGMVASIVLPSAEMSGAPSARVILHDGGELQLDLTGDLSGKNGGMLIFTDGGQRPEYVPWSDVQQIDFLRPISMRPQPGLPGN